MTLILAPYYGSNRVGVPTKHSQALARLRVPEPNIARTGKELSLVRMPGQILDVSSRPLDHPQAAPGADVPQPDRAVSAARQESGLACVEDGMVNAIRVSVECLQQLPGR